jgi:hypothetical protein
MVYLGLIGLAVLALAGLSVLTLLYIHVAEWVIVHYDAWVARRAERRKVAADRGEPDQDISMW